MKTKFQGIKDYDSLIKLQHLEEKNERKSKISAYGFATAGAVTAGITFSLSPLHKDIADSYEMKLYKAHKSKLEEIQEKKSIINQEITSLKIPNTTIDKLIDEKINSIKKEIITIQKTEQYKMFEHTQNKIKDLKSPGLILSAALIIIGTYKFIQSKMYKKSAENLAKRTNHAYRTQKSS
ncbi:hypothetical protein K9L97_04160 [Candidatus Woesearchaeota archaeon]|nr:hypothetical protein [Candidatus Woesearchaeota archaeon]